MNIINLSIVVLFISSVNNAKSHSINLYTKYCVDSSQNCYNQDLCGTGLATDYLGSKETAINGDICLPWEYDTEFHSVKDIQPNFCRSHSKNRPWCYVHHNETHSEAQDCFKSCNEDKTSEIHDNNVLSGAIAEYVVKLFGKLRVVIYGKIPKPVAPSSVTPIEESDEGSGSSNEEGSGMNSSGEEPISSGNNIDEGSGDDASELDVSESISSGSDSSGMEIATSEESESEGSGSNASGANSLELEGCGSTASGLKSVEEESSGLESEELVTAVVEEATVTPKQGATVTPKFEGSGSSSVSSEPSGEVLASGNGSGQDFSEEGSGQQIITDVTNEISSEEGSGEEVTNIIPHATVVTDIEGSGLHTSGIDSEEPDDSGSGVDDLGSDVSDLIVEELASSGAAPDISAVDSSGVDIPVSNEPESEASGLPASGFGPELIESVGQGVTVTSKPVEETYDSSSESSATSGEREDSTSEISPGKDSPEEDSGQQIITDVSDKISSEKFSGDDVTNIISHATTPTPPEDFIGDGYFTVSPPKPTTRPSNSNKTCIDKVKGCVHPSFCDRSHTNAIYTGNQATTQTGVPCVEWGYGHNRHNYCRSFENGYGPWCRTSKTEWDYCFPLCGVKTPNIDKEDESSEHFDSLSSVPRIQNFYIKNSNVSINNS